MLLSSSHPARLVAFYRDVLGVPLQPARVPGFAPHHGCELSSVYFAILTAKEPRFRRSSCSCFAFYVDDVKAASSALAAAGVTQLQRARRTPLGLISRFLDPDGNPFELYQP